MRILIGGTIVLLLIVAAVLLWPSEHVPTLPDVGPGAKHVSGAANLSVGDAGRVEGGGEAVKVPQPPTVRDASSASK